MFIQVTEDVIINTKYIATIEIDPDEEDEELYAEVYMMSGEQISITKKEYENLKRNLKVIG